MAEPRLRQADWRFLLPLSELRTSLVLDERRGEALRSAMGVGIVSRPQPGCDLAVAAPSPEALATAFRSLRPGGVCYVESRSPLGRGAQTLRTRLEGAGFGDVRVYWAWPRAAPSIWVSLDAPAAAISMLRRRRGSAAVGAWRAARSLGLLRPLCATGVRPPVDPNLGPHGVRLPPLDGSPTWNVVAPGMRSINKVVAAVGVDDEPEPVLVLKFPRTEAAESALAREAANLRAIEDAAGGGIAGIPRLLFESRKGNRLRAVAETALQGVPIYRELDRTRHSELTRKATDWLIALSRLDPPAPTRPETPSEIVAEIGALTTTHVQRELADASRAVLAPANGVRRVFEQRDFSPWNVHLGGDGRLVVYDWESAEPAGFPALDLVYFLAYTNFFLAGAMRSGRYTQAYRGVFAPDGVGTSCLERYCAAVGVERDAIPALRLLTWLIHARSAMRREGAQPPAELFFSLVDAELAGSGVSPAHG
jgi:hypothetical protein